MTKSTTVEWLRVLQRIRDDLPEKAITSGGCWSCMAKSTDAKWTIVLQRLHVVPEEALNTNSTWSDIANLDDETWKILEQRFLICRNSWFDSYSFWQYFKNTTPKGINFWNNDGRDDMGKHKKIRQCQKDLGNI